jgi:hypothetical protein
MSAPYRCALMVDFGFASIHPTPFVKVVGWIERSEIHHCSGGGQ